MIKHLNKIEQYKKWLLRLEIDHRDIQAIDNASILLLTAGISSIFNNKKLIKRKKLAPKREIDERLTTIGYWESLCLNPTKLHTNLDYLKITRDDGRWVKNDLHTDILDFFIKHHNIPDRDKLFDAIYEAMVNAKEHAYEGEERNLWFLGAYDKNKNEIEFLIYDKGMGIFKSLENSQKRLAKFLTKCRKILGIEETFEKLCTTNLSKYKGKDRQRGLGMKAYKDFVDSIKECDEKVSASLEVATDNLLYSSISGVKK